MVAFDSRRPTRAPLASEVEVVGALATDMSFADMVVEELGGVATLTAALPLACEIVDGATVSGRKGGRAV